MYVSSPGLRVANAEDVEILFDHGLGQGRGAAVKFLPGRES